MTAGKYQVGFRTHSPLWIITGVISGAVAIDRSYADQQGLLLPGLFLLATLLLILKGMDAKVPLRGGVLSVLLVILTAVGGFVHDRDVHGGEVTLVGTLASALSIVVAVGATWTSGQSQRS